MKVPRYIFIHLRGRPLEAFMDLLQRSCASDWNISHLLGKYTAEPDKNLFCAGCGNYDPNGSRLSLYLKDADTLCVQNVIAYEHNQSSCYRCNNILEGFYQRVVLPSILGLDVTAELSSEEVFLQDVVGAEVAALLSKFSKMANKSTGSFHPCDRCSWFDFLLAANAQGTPLNTELLIETLKEDGWSKEAARSLGSEFEFGMKLLYYSAGRAEGRTGH